MAEVDSTRRGLTIALVAASLVPLLRPCSGLAQPAGMRRIGFLGNLAQRGAREAALITGLHELGYIEGQHFVMEWRLVAGRLEKLPESAAELIRSGASILVTSGIAATLAARKASATIPIVMSNSSDNPVRHGLAISLARPGGNVTGLVDISPELAGKRLELLTQLVPKVSRVGVIWDSASPAAASQVQETEKAARALGVQIDSFEVKSPTDLDPAFRSAPTRVQAVVVITYGFLNSARERITSLERKSRLPVMYTNTEFAPLGGLVAYASDVIELHRRAASYVDRIVKGAKPGDLPIEQPTKFELVFNLKTARALGLDIPQSLLLRTDKVIE